MKQQHAENDKRIRIGALQVAALLTAAGLFVLLALRFAYFFDLNDDVLMKDILSGVYTGTPEGRNIQMLFPISFLISLLYHVTRQVDWYGIFLLTCQFGCFALVLYRSLSLADTRRRKWLAGAAVTALCLTFLLPHLVFLQYSITTGMLCATAAWWLATLPDAAVSNPPGGIGEGIRTVWKSHWLPLCLLALAYVLRSEMTLFLLPLVALAALLPLVLQDPDRPLLESWALQKRRLLLLLGGVLCVLFLGTAADAIATASPDWRAFRSFFDARTRLYDYYFYDMPTYAEEPEVFDVLGLDASDAGLLDNYNFSLADDLDEEAMWRLVAEAKSKHEKKIPPAGRIKLALREYIDRGRHLEDGVYGVLTALASIGLAGWLLLHRGEARARRGALLLILLWIFRSGLWLYLLYSGRAPERLTHPLYLLELLLLFALWRRLCRRAEGLYRVVAVFLALALLFLPGQYGRTAAEAEHRERMQPAWEAYLDYCAAHPEEIFFTDVYSTVAYSERVFDRFGTASVMSNQDVMGGWAAKSPLYQKRLAAQGLSTMQDAIAHDARVRVVCAANRDIRWLKERFASRGIRGRFEEVERVGEVFVIYRFLGE